MNKGSEEAKAGEKRSVIYTWHNNPCRLLVKPVFNKGIKRNALIELLDSGERIVVPWRSLRKSIN